MNCVCGRKIESTTATPWLSATFDSSGKVIRGTCVHGFDLDFSEFKIGDRVEMLNGFWKGCHGKIIHKTEYGHFGIEVLTDAYGPVTVWYDAPNLKKAN